MSIITVGIDLAKNVFAVHGVDESGRAVLVKPKVRRDELLPLIANLPPCVIGMEACTGTHHWARLFMRHGHVLPQKIERLRKEIAPHLEDLPGHPNRCAGDLLVDAAITKTPPDLGNVDDHCAQHGVLLVHHRRMPVAVAG